MTWDIRKKKQNTPLMLNDTVVRPSRICYLSPSLLISLAFPRSSYIFKKANSSITPRFLSYRKIRVQEGEKRKESIAGKNVTVVLQPCLPLNPVSEVVFIWRRAAGAGGGSEQAGGSERPSSSRAARPRSPCPPCAPGRIRLENY